MYCSVLYDVRQFLVRLNQCTHAAGIYAEYMMLVTREITQRECTYMYKYIINEYIGGERKDTSHISFELISH